MFFVMKYLRWIALVAVVTALVSCSCVREGVVVAKHARKGMPRVYGSGSLYSFNERDVHWIEVEGRNQNGRMVRKSIILFRNDWSLISVGDHWHCGQAVAKARDGKS